MKTSVLEFKLLDDTFCFNTKHIEYVFELEEYKTIKSLHASVIGMTKYNYDVMLLIDTAKLYSDENLDFSTEKSVVVIKDFDGMFYGMVVDEITKLEEIESVNLSVELNTQDMVINHYKDEDHDDIVSEIDPFPLFKKYDIPAMSSVKKEDYLYELNKKNDNSLSYLLFTINNNSYAIESKYVKEVVEQDTKVFNLELNTKNIKGAIAVRDEIITLLEIEKSENVNDIVIVEIEDKKFGIGVDEVYDIENFSINNLENIESSMVSAFYNYNGKVVAILNPSIYEMGSNNNKINSLDIDSDVNKKIDYLIFLMDNQKYSINMSNVRQVVETNSLNKTQSSSIVSSKNSEFISTWNNRAVNIVRIDHELCLSCKKVDSLSIFIEYDNHTVAFMVHDIDNIVYLSESDITQSCSKEDNIIDGAIIYNDEVIPKLNIKYLIAMG